MYENTFGSNTLIICPANLQDMWEKYRKQYDMKADIMSMAKPIDVDNARYYKLIIVDESHNLRNSQGVRYRNIRDLIQKQDCKVLLLTATPYNKQYKDLSSQLRLFIDDDTDLGIRPEAYIRSIGGERKFAEKHEDFIRSIKAFERSEFQEDWQELMKLFLIRRTRTFIKENYAKTDSKNGRKYLEFKDGHKSYFPDRIPKAIKFQTTEGDQYSRLYSEEMVSLMESLKLPRYGLIHYLDEKKVYDSGRNGIRSPFSAMGPTLDGRIKPDVMAPGQNIVSSYSTFFINNPKNVNGSVQSDVRHFEFNGRTYAWNSNAGTSMSAPVVAGAIALWLQADPTLMPADCLEIFSKTCIHYDTTLAYPNNLYGYGQIDVVAGLKEVLRRKALGINMIDDKREVEQDDNRIYLLDGRCVGTGDINLPKGIYIRNGKKLIK